MLAEKLRAASSGAATGRIAIQYVGGASGTGSDSDTAVISLTSLTGGLASSPAAGDFVVLFLATCDSASVDFSVSTYTRYENIYANASFDTNLEVWYKRMSATPDTSASVSGLTTPSAFTYTVMVWRNVDAIINFDVAATTATGVGALANPPSITPATTGAVILAAGAAGGAPADIGTYTTSNLSGFITTSSTSAGLAAFSVIGSGYFEWSSGAFNPAAFGFTGTNNTANQSWASVTLALRPTGTTFVGTASAETSSGATNITVNKPTGTASGDLLVAVMAATTIDQTWTGDTGWTEAADNGFIPNLRVAYKVAGGSEPSTYTFTGSSGFGTKSAIILTVRGLSYASVGAFGTIQTTSPVTVSASLTTTVSPAVLLYLAGSSGAATSWSTPTDMNYIAQEIGSQNGSTIIFSQYTTSVAGTAFTKDSTYTGTSRSNAIIVELS